MKRTRMIGSRMRLKMLIEVIKFKLCSMYKEVKIQTCGMSLLIVVVAEMREKDSKSKEVIRVRLLTDSIVGILTCPDADLEIKMAEFCMDVKDNLMNQLFEEAASKVINIYQYY